MAEFDTESDGTIFCGKGICLENNVLLYFRKDLIYNSLFKLSVLSV